MKYINREYGFAFRPPFFDRFSEVNSEGPEISSQNFPNRYIIGAGYDYSAINGAMLIGKHGSLWGVKVSYLSHGKWLDGDKFLQNMGIGCANTSDGTFAHFSSGPLSLKWLKHNEQGLMLEISARKTLRVRVIFYPCFDWPGELSIEGAFVKGRSPYIGVVKGEVKLAENNAVYMGRYQVVCDDRPEREFFMAQSYNKPLDSANGAFNEAIMEFYINKNQPKVYVYSAVGDGDVLGMDVPRIDKIAKLISTAELRYGVNRTMGSGELGGNAESMLNSIMWSRVYYPYFMQEKYAATRASINNHFDLSGLDSNCAELLGCYVGDGSDASPQLAYTLEDKLFGILSLWHVYSHVKNKSEVLNHYKFLKTLYPPDNDLVLSEDKSEIAYRCSDSPLKELDSPESGAMYSLDLSCLKLLAFDILERVGVAFNLAEAKAYGLARKRHVKLINDTFYNEEKGLYLNRYASGAWAKNYGATSFYPLIAGAVDEEEKLARLAANLINPKKFWGDYPIPTISKDNKAYGKKGKPNNNGKREPPYLQYRGSVVPYVNYLIYHGLKRYGLDDIAGELALRSARLWRNNDSANLENYSIYLPTGKRVKDQKYISNNGNMLALMGIQELIDVDYFRDDARCALRFGTFVKGNHSLTNLKLLGRAYSIDVNNTTTTLLVNNGSAFIGEGGKFVVRQFMETPNGCEFIIDARSEINIKISIPFSGDEVAKSLRNFTVPEGRSKVVINGNKLNISLI